MLQSFMSVWCLGPTFPHVSNRLPATKVRNCRRQQKRTLTYNKVHTGGVKMKQKINIESGENILFSMWPDPIHCHTLSYTVIHCHVQDIYIHIYIIYIYIYIIYIYYIYIIYIYIIYIIYIYYIYIYYIYIYFVITMIQQPTASSTFRIPNFLAKTATAQLDLGSP